jgi:hypothetical protein
MGSAATTGLIYLAAIDPTTARLGTALSRIAAVSYKSALVNFACRRSVFWLSPRPLLIKKFITPGHSESRCKRRANRDAVAKQIA